MRARDRRTIRTSLLTRLLLAPPPRAHRAATYRTLGPFAEARPDLPVGTIVTHTSLRVAGLSEGEIAGMLRGGWIEADPEQAPATRRTPPHTAMAEIGHAAR